MIPYQEMTFSDWDFYWGESVLFHKLNGKWVGVYASNRSDSDGDYRHHRDALLEEISQEGGKLKFQVAYSPTSTDAVYVDPMEPFHSSDWITFEPPLGYFLIEGNLQLLTCSVPRNRYKGLHSNRLRALPPVDVDILHTSVPTQEYGPRTGYRHSYSALVLEIARRLNEPFSTSWYLSIMGALTASEPSPVILAANVVFVPDTETNGRGHLLHNGSLLGILSIKGTTLEFSPRNDCPSKLAGSVSAWVRSKVFTVPVATQP
jgi:hypothetical protein